MQLLLRRFHWQKQTSGHLCEAVSTWVNFTGEDPSLSVNNASLQAGFLTGRETKSWVPEHSVHLSSCFPAMIHFAFKLWVRTKSSFLQVLFRYLVTETGKVALTNTCAYMHAYTHETLGTDGEHEDTRHPYYLQCMPWYAHLILSNVPSLWES